MNRFSKLFCFWLLALWCVNEANSYPLDVYSYQQENFCLLYKLAPNLSSVPHLKNLLGYDTTEPAKEGEPFAVFVQEGNETETVKYCSSSEKISSAVVEECIGRCKVKDERTAVEFELQAVYRKKSYEDSQMLLVALPSTSVQQLVTCENTTLLISCPTRQQQRCLHVHTKEDSNAKPVAVLSNLYRRSAVIDDHMISYRGSHDAKSPHRNVALGVVVSVVCVVLLVLVVALCAGGSQTYDPVQNETGGAVSLKKQSTSEVAIPISSQDANTSVTVSVAMKDEPLSVHKTNGSFSSKEHPSPQQQPQDVLPNTDSKPESSKETPASKDTSETEDPKTKSLSISARSYDPLPEIPGVEDNKEEDDEVAEAGYDYARFPERNVDRMAGSESEGEEDNNQAEPDKQQQQVEAAVTAGVVPYGKVSRHSNSGKKKETESEEYAEVRETFHITTRTRAVTEPIDPATLGMELRDKRAFTESATHLPLPAIPHSQRMAQQNNKPKIRERLYESVDEMEGNEDMYESVPDDLKIPDSPITPNPANSSPSKIPLATTTSVPLPPSSPIPTRNLEVEKGAEKKALDKTLSTGDGEKRRFSFFNRKKATSVSAVKHKKDKELSHHTSTPITTATLASSPPQISPPPLPSIPAPAPPFNEDDEDDLMYDTPQLDLIKGRHTSESDALLETSPTKTRIQEAKAKSASLPMSMRTAGGSPFMPRPQIPLPDLPETSGGATATVVHKRVFEDPVNGEQTGPYDMVQILPEPSIDDPSYDTVRPEDILIGEHRENEHDPGYDRVKQGNEQQQQQQEQAENEVEGGTSDELAGNMKYAKVTRPASPEDGTATPGVPPEHDEEGYAVVPQEIKMRKRAMSASKGVQQKTHGDQSGAKRGGDRPYESVKKTGDQSKARSSSPEVVAIMAEPNEQYAVVDVIAKRKRKQKQKESPFVEIEIRRSAASPNPPPLPPVGDLGDLAEFDQPPVPLQSDGVHELVDNKHLLVVAGGANDPPYARVTSKTDHPYTELDLAPKDSSGPAKLVQPTDSTDSTDGGYDTVGGKRSSEEDHNLRDQALGYDTVNDGETVAQKTKGRSSLEREMPKLETTTEIQQPTYDVLEGPSESTASSPSGNLYDTLESDSPPMNGVSPEDMEEDRYEEIDEEQRLKLITKYYKQST